MVWAAEYNSRLTKCTWRPFSQYMNKTLRLIFHRERERERERGKITRIENPQFMHETLTLKKNYDMVLPSLV